MDRAQKIITQFGPNGRRSTLDAQELCARLDAARQTLPHPFEAERVRIVASVADAISRHKGELSPAIRYLGFWTRAAALKQLERSFAATIPPHTLRRPRGMTFHLPPRNVETIFLYSWILSFLAGNANIVRLPQEVSGTVGWVLDLFLAALDASSERSQLFVHYPLDTDLSALISAHSDARMVWGGDAKVGAFERLPLRNGGKSLWFGDRSSLCLLDGAAVGALGPAEREALAQKFFNDVFVFDQMACSSPQALYVVGTPTAHLEGVRDLLAAIGHVAAAKGAIGAAGHQIAKMTAAFSAAASGDVIDLSWRGTELTTVVSGVAERVDRRIGGGFLSVVFLPDLDALNGVLRERDQTITHFGFSEDAIRLAAERNLGPGVSRWTPVGSALDFDSVWDGYDILSELTRACRVG
ncbi:acyl-CoA reductase-like NAD-dependent aldehyde dehydrogenase [Azorhizobium sp. AG788]|uniref:acyl-CoA reductase n=1 Tax=Azorhizobium sp. AG788 TaxID=2183897 RepID=UPI0010601BE3|nr:acyl-CoA reductase [Azorhizobium sp. AG788]TDT99267.1 acyl-CoA reductase-like NAD-dependent aldehyde dehydrogenase [Azorhizobium sp. AG788]